MTKREAMIGLISLIVGMLLGSQLFGGTPATAVHAALVDIQQLPEADRPFARYVWLHDERRAEPNAGLVRYAVNATISRSTTLVDIPLVTPDLLRVDLRRLAQDANDLVEIIQLWDRLAIDEPYFHVHVEGIPSYGAHVGLANAVILQGLQGAAQAGVVRDDWLIVKSLSTLDGGLYYEFTGQAGKTLADVLDDVGADFRLAAQLRSDERAAVLRSGVTGKPRRIDVFTFPGVRPSAGNGLAAITRDINDEQLGDPDFDPIRNLLKFKVAGGESIIQRPNGTHLFSLFQGDDDAILDVAPDNVATDSTGRPHAPGGTRLQPAVSCIRCHLEDGYRPFKNDVKQLIAGDLDVFGDISEVDQIDVLNRLAGLYGGQLDGNPRSPIQRARDDYMWTVMQITGWPLNEAVTKLSTELATTYGRYVYDPVTAETAIRELGYARLANGDAAPTDILRQLVNHLPTAADGIAPEDPLLGALVAGLGISRPQWEAIYADIALRVTLKGKN